MNSFTIFILVISLLFIGSEKQGSGSENIDREAQKSQNIQLFLKEDSQFADSEYLINKVDSIAIPNVVDTVSIFLGTSSSSGFLWKIDSSRSDISVVRSDYMSLVKDNRRKYFQKLSFSQNGCWSNKKITVLLRRPFDSEHSSKDSCILQFIQDCK